MFTYSVPMAQGSKVVVHTTCGSCGASHSHPAPNGRLARLIAQNWADVHYCPAQAD